MKDGSAPRLDFAPTPPRRPSILWPSFVVCLGVALGMALSATFFAWNVWANRIVRVPRLWYTEPQWMWFATVAVAGGLVGFRRFPFVAVVGVGTVLGFVCIAGLFLLLIGFAR